MKKILFLILITTLAMLAFLTASVSAQDTGIDVDNMDNAQLTTLLLQILNKLQEEENPQAEPAETEELEPETIQTEEPVTEPVPEEQKPEISEKPADPIPADDPEAIEEVIQITIYENKKLIIEQLPEYMFFKKEEKPEEDDNKPGGSKCPPGQQWVCDIYGRCYCTSAKG